MTEGEAQPAGTGGMLPGTAVSIAPPLGTAADAKAAGGVIGIGGGRCADEFDRVVTPTGTPLDPVERFWRTVPSGWGTGPWGPYYFLAGGGASVTNPSFQNGWGILSQNGVRVAVDIPFVYPVEVVVRFKFTGSTSADFNKAFEVRVFGQTDDAAATYRRMFVGGVDNSRIESHHNEPGGVQTAPVAAPEGTLMAMRIRFTDTETSMRVWTLPNAEPSGWHRVKAGSSLGPLHSISFHTNFSIASTVEVHLIQIFSGLPTVTGGWGTGPLGTWTADDPGGWDPIAKWALEVDGAAGRAYMGNDHGASGTLVGLPFEQCEWPIEILTDWRAATTRTSAAEDTFTRVVAGGLGTGELGTWLTVGGGDPGIVNGSYAELADQTTYLPMTLPQFSQRMIVDGIVLNDVFDAIDIVLGNDAHSAYIGAKLHPVGDGTWTFQAYAKSPTTAPDSTTPSATTVSIGTRWSIEIRHVGDTCRAYLYPTDEDPPAFFIAPSPRSGLGAALAGPGRGWLVPSADSGTRIFVDRVLFRIDDADDYLEFEFQIEQPGYNFYNNAPDLPEPYNYVNILTRVRWPDAYAEGNPIAFNQIPSADSELDAGLIPHDDVDYRHFDWRNLWLRQRLRIEQDGTVLIRTWPRGDPEPTEWMAQSFQPTNGFSDSGFGFLLFYIVQSWFGGSDRSTWLEVDRIEFVSGLCCGGPALQGSGAWPSLSSVDE